MRRDEGKQVDMAAEFAWSRKKSREKTAGIFLYYLTI
jgi:hypothetical protein